MTKIQDTEHVHPIRCARSCWYRVIILLYFHSGRTELAKEVQGKKAKKQCGWPPTESNTLCRILCCVYRLSIDKKKFQN